MPRFLATGYPCRRRGVAATPSPRNIRVAMPRPLSTEHPRRDAATRLHGISASRRRDPSPRNVHVAAAASPRPVSTEYPRRDALPPPQALHDAVVADFGGVFANGGLFLGGRGAMLELSDDVAATAAACGQWESDQGLVNLARYRRRRRMLPSRTTPPPRNIPSRTTPSPRNIHVVAAASPRPVAVEYSHYLAVELPRRGIPA